MLFLFYLSIESKKPNITTLYDDIKNNFNTGDIILFTCYNHNDLIDRIVYNCRTKLVGTNYGHSGIILKTDKNIYVIECCGYDQCGFNRAKYLSNKKKNGGIRLIKLYDLLLIYHYKYNASFSVMHTSAPIDNNLLINKLNKYIDIDFQQKSILLLLAVTDIFISNEIAKLMAVKIDDKKMICTEFTYKLLEDCGIFKPYPSKLFWPHTFANIKFYDLLNVSYSEPIKFVITNNDKYYCDKCIDYSKLDNKYNTN